MIRLRIWLYAAALTGLATIAGCGGSTSKTGQGSLPDPTLFFVNGSPDTPSADFYVNEDVKAAGVDYLLSSSDFIKIPFVPAEIDEGAVDVVVTNAGSTTDLDRVALGLERDTHTLVAAIGLQSGATGIESPKRLQLINHLITRDAPTGNRARIYVLHGLLAAPGEETPKIAFETPGDNPQVQFSDIEYGKTNSEKPADDQEGTAPDPLIDSGSYTFQVRRSDLDQGEVYATADLTLQPGRVYLALVSGIVGDADPAKRPRITLIELATK